MGTRARRGQAFVEMAIGMFALALVVSALVAFLSYIVKSLDLMRTSRADAGTAAMGSSFGSVHVSRRDVVEVEPFAEEHLFGTKTLTVREDVWMTPMKIPD